jgi:hypothetical protein
MKVLLTDGDKKHLFFFIRPITGQIEKNLNRTPFYFTAYHP